MKIAANGCDELGGVIDGDGDGLLGTRFAIAVDASTVRFGPSVGVWKTESWGQGFLGL